MSGNVKLERLKLQEISQLFTLVGHVERMSVAGHRYQCGRQTGGGRRGRVAWAVRRRTASLTNHRVSPGGGDPLSFEIIYNSRSKI